MWQMKEIEVNAEDEDKETSTVGDATEARVTYGKRKKKKVTKKVLQTDIFRAYSNRKVAATNLDTPSGLAGTRCLDTPCRRVTTPTTTL